MAYWKEMLLVYFIAFHRISAEGKRKEGKTLGKYVCKTLMICLSFRFRCNLHNLWIEREKRDRDNFIERITLSWKELQSSDMHFHWQLCHQIVHLETVSFDRRNQQCGPASSLFGCLRAHCSQFISDLFYFGNTTRGKRYTYSVREYTNCGESRPPWGLFCGI